MVAEVDGSTTAPDPTVTVGDPPRRRFGVAGLDGGSVGCRYLVR